MGIKGDKLKQESMIAAEQLVEKLAGIEGISRKRMFGGHGIFCDGEMFGIVDSKGQCFLKADDALKATFEEKGALKHGRMPYYSIPEDILNN